VTRDALTNYNSLGVVQAVKAKHEWAVSQTVIEGCGISAVTALLALAVGPGRARKDR
jgi:hypothetical protein